MTTQQQKNYSAAWDLLFQELPKEIQDEILAVGDGSASADLACRALEKIGFYDLMDNGDEELAEEIAAMGEK